MKAIVKKAIVKKAVVAKPVVAAPAPVAAAPAKSMYAWLRSVVTSPFRGRSGKEGSR